MPHPAPLPDRFAAGPFSVADALAASVGRQRLRASDLSSPFHGIRTSSTVETVLDACRAYLPRLKPGEYFSHSTAAVIYGIPLPGPIERSRELHVAADAPAQRPRTRGVVGHRVHAPSRTFRGLPVIDPIHAWCQLALVLSADELVVAGDYLVRRKRALATLDQLNAVVAKSKARGIRAVRLAVGQVRAGTDSPMETRLRLALVGGGLPEPVIGHMVRDDNGDFVATPDLAYIAERIAIEYEGELHWADRRVFAEDIERRELLEDAGWLVIRVIADHLGIRTPQLVRRVRAALELRRV